MNKPDLIKYLYQEGMNQKMIELITKSKQSYISKVINGKIQKNISSAPNFDVDESQRYNILAVILSMPELPTEGITEDDKRYIQLLKYCGISKIEIYKLYSYVKESQFNKIFRDNSIDFRDFDANLLGIDNEDFDNLFGGK